MRIKKYEISLKFDSFSLDNSLSLMFDGVEKILSCLFSFILVYKLVVFLKKDGALKK